MTVASYMYCARMMQYPVLNEILTELHTVFAYIRDEDVPKHDGRTEVLYDYDEGTCAFPHPKHAYVLRNSLAKDCTDVLPAPTMDELCMAFSLLNDRGLGGRLDLSLDDERGDFTLFTPKDGRRFRSFNVKLNFPKSNYVEDYLAVALIAVMDEMKEDGR